MIQQGNSICAGSPYGTNALYYIGSTIDSSSTLWLTPHHPFFDSPSTLHWFFIDSSMIFHWLFISSSLILYQLSTHITDYAHRINLQCIIDFFYAFLMFYGSLILCFVGWWMLYISIDFTYINWYFYLLFQTSINLLVTCKHQNSPTIVVVTSNETYPAEYCEVKQILSSWVLWGKTNPIQLSAVRWTNPIRLSAVR